LDLQEYNYEIQHISGIANIPADVLSHPPRANQGENNNQEVTILAPHWFINAATVHDAPSKDQKRALMLLVHDHPMARHPGQDETIRKVKWQWP
jgi:hypothetical protein